MTKLELANQLVQQLQQQNSSNLDMIDKLQQQVQVQQTWFQWAAGIFIASAIAIVIAAIQMMKVENKRSKEEIINLKNELGINEISELVESQKETLVSIKGESNQYKKDIADAKKLVESLDKQIVMQNTAQLTSAGISLQLIIPGSEIELVKGIANVEPVLSLPKINKVKRADLVGFIRNLLKFWENYESNDVNFKKKNTVLVVEMLNGTKDLILKNPGINGELLDNYIDMLNEAVAMEHDIK